MLMRQQSQQRLAHWSSYCYTFQWIHMKQHRYIWYVCVNRIQMLKRSFATEILRHEARVRERKRDRETEWNLNTIWIFRFWVFGFIWKIIFMFSNDSMGKFSSNEKFRIQNVSMHVSPHTVPCVVYALFVSVQVQSGLSLSLRLCVSNLNIKYKLTHKPKCQLLNLKIVFHCLPATPHRSYINVYQFIWSQCTQPWNIDLRPEILLRRHLCAHLSQPFVYVVQLFFF